MSDELEVLANVVRRLESRAALYGYRVPGLELLRATIDGIEVAIVSPEDLVLSKLVWARDSHSEVQLGDVRGILRGSLRLDTGYMEIWAARLGILQFYREAVR